METEKLIEMEKEALSLADAMAAAAAQFNSQNYTVFLENREMLKEVLHKIMMLLT